MRANIIIHSISGNLYIIAETFREKLEEHGFDARLYRVSDPDLHLAANERTEAIEYYEEITALPEATPEKLESADIIILGTPSRFALYINQSLEGRKFYAFSSTTEGEYDGLRAASSLYLWSEMMGLVNIPYEPYVHEESDMMPNRPSEIIDDIADRFADLASIPDLPLS